MAFGKWGGFRPAELLLSLLALLAIFWLVDAEKTYRIIITANPVLFVAGMLVYFSTALLMTYRIRLILSNVGWKAGYREAFWANMGGLLASDFTPARTGYFITPLLLSKNSGVPVEKGMVAIVSPQIAEFFIKAIGAGLAIMLIVQTVPGLTGDSLFLWAGVGVMIAFCIAMSVALFIPHFAEFASKFTFLPFVSEGVAFLRLLQSHRAKVTRIYPQIFAISVLIFAIKGIEWSLFGAALGITFTAQYPSLFIFMVLQPLVTVFQFAPVPTVAGLGLAEGSAVAAMAFLGVPPELAVAYALLIRGGTVLVNSIGVAQLARFVAGKR